MADGGDPDAVLSDVEDDDPSPSLIPAAATSSEDPRLKDLLSDLDKERQSRRAAEVQLSDLQTSFNRLKALAHEAIRKRDEANRDKDDASRQKDEILRQKDDLSRQKDEISRQKDEILRQKDAARSEIEAAAQMLVTGIDKISGKVRGVKNFAAGGLPRSDKYTGLPAVAYGVIKRTNEIVEELLLQTEAVGKERDRARERVEQRNYEIAIEVSQLEATIAGLGEQVKSLEKAVGEKDARISELEQELGEVRKFGEECNEKASTLQERLDVQSNLVVDQLSWISRAHERVHEILRNAELGTSEFDESMFVWKEMDVGENLKTSLEGMASLCELAKVAAGKVKEVKGRMEEKVEEVQSLNETVARLVGEKQHIGTLLRSALSSKASDVRQVAEDGLREVGIDFKFDGNGYVGNGDEEDGDDEVYTLAGALESTVKTSQAKILELQNLVDALRAESSLRKAHLDAQEKEITHLKHCIKDLEEREHIANENVEGLMIDIAAAEEEIARWKIAAEEEAAAGKAVEEDFMAQLAAVRRELDEAKQVMVESENKLKFKEETAAAAMAARDAAEKSLKLADLRAARLRERLEELNRQLEASDDRNDSGATNRPRYVCWPWQWLGLNFVRYQPDIEVASNEMELSEPLL